MFPATCKLCGLNSEVALSWPAFIALWGLYLALKRFSGDMELAAGVTIGLGLLVHLISTMYKKLI